MNDHPELPPLAPEPTPGEKQSSAPPPKMTWLFVGFSPSLAGLIMLQTFTNPMEAMLVLLGLNAPFSVLAGICLVRGMKSVETTGARTALTLFLIGFLFIANFAIVILLGCNRSQF